MFTNSTKKSTRILYSFTQKYLLMMSGTKHNMISLKKSSKNHYCIVRISTFTILISLIDHIICIQYFTHYIVLFTLKVLQFCIAV